MLSRRPCGVWTVLVAFSLYAVASPATVELPESSARNLLQNPSALLSFTSDLMGQREREGWRFETRPGQRLVLTQRSTGPFREVYVTPPATAGLDLGFQITRLQTTNGTLRLAIAAFNRSFTTARARRVFSVVSVAESVDEIRIRFEQTLQSLSSEVDAGEGVRGAASTSLWQEILHAFIPAAHAEPRSSVGEILVFAMQALVVVGIILVVVWILRDPSLGTPVNARTALTSTTATALSLLLSTLIVLGARSGTQ